MHLAIFAIILNKQDQVLLCHRRDHDLWNLPGGAAASGETPWDAVVREVREETGLEVVVDRLVGVHAKPEKDELVFTFVCSVVGGKLVLTDESDATEYMSVEGIPANTSKKQLERLKDFFSDPGRVQLGVQTGPSSIELLGRGEL